MKKNLSRIIITIVMIIASLYFLYPTYKDSKLNSELKKLTGQDSLDFVDKNNQELINARDKRLKLGLDLKGGMYVVLDVDVVKLLEDMAKKKDDGLSQISESLDLLMSVHKEKPGSLLLQTLFYAEADEIVNIYSGAYPDQKVKVSNLLNEIDPANRTKYSKIMGN